MRLLYRSGPRPDWLVRLHNPGGLLWWPGYLAWKWFRICWTAHRPRRVEFLDDCDMFWDAEELFLKFRRDPSVFEDAELSAPPKVCLFGNLTTAGGGSVSSANSTEGGYTLRCLCGRHDPDPGVWVPSAGAAGGNGFSSGYGVEGHGVGEGRWE